MDALVLQIFPESTLAASVTTTVWVGVWVMVFFNLRLGWPLSGLVVPGYLVPLLISKPMSAGVVCVEALLTFAIVWVLSEHLDRRWGWSSFFGRDRFFAMVVVSVLVRSLLDGWLLPWLGPRMNDVLGLELDYRNHWHSYGLIIVALMANYFWKPGILRGGWTLGVTVTATYVLVRFVLVEWTNFSMGGLQYVYEDIAASLLASPKAYMILLTTAFLASRLNLRYGWDYNGILIPALLALQWQTPIKIVTSFAEAGVILALSALVLKLPIWRSMTMEGSRKILLFFNIAFAYRILLSLLLPMFLPELKVSDMFGFGYLLSTLLAIKAHDQWRLVRLTREVLQVSMVGAVAGNLAGFALALSPSLWPQGSLAAVPETAMLPVRCENLSELVRQDKLLLYRSRLPEVVGPPSAAERERFRTGLLRLRSYVQQRRGQDLIAARRYMRQVNYQVQRVDQHYLYLREYSPPRGWGMFVIDLRSDSGLLVEVPRPLEHWGTVESGLCLFQRLRGSGLAVAGPRSKRSRTGSGLRDNDTLFGIYHQLMQQGNTLQVSGYTEESVRTIARIPQSQTGQAIESLPSTLWIKRELPAGLHLPTVTEALSRCRIEWNPSPLENSLRDATHAGFSELLLNRKDRRRLLSLLSAERFGDRPPAAVVRATAGYAQIVAETKEQIAGRGSNAYQVPREEELLFLDEEVLKPLLTLIRRVASGADLSETDHEELHAIAAAADLVGYQVALGGGSSATGFVMLRENTTTPRHHWGTFLFRWGRSNPLIIEVPRPVHERNALVYGASLFRRLPAAGLLIAGAHPFANQDGTADVSRAANRTSAFHLAHQVLLREAGRDPMLVVQSRSIRAPVGADLVLATNDGSRAGELPQLTHQLWQQLQRDGLRVAFTDGDYETAGYDVTHALQASSLSHFENKEFACLWLSPSLRADYRLDEENRLQLAQFAALQIPLVEMDLGDYLQSLPVNGNRSRTCKLAVEHRQAVVDYLATGDVVRLEQLRRVPGAQLCRLLDPPSGQAFLLFNTQPGTCLPIVSRLTDPLDEPESIRCREITATAVRNYVNSTATWLEVGP